MGLEKGWRVHDGFQGRSCKTL